MNELSVFNGNLPAKLAMQREGGVIVRQGMAANLHEQCRAGLANTALQNTGNLSALAEHLTSIAPSGERRYHAIVDAYSLSATQRIARW